MADDRLSDDEIRIRLQNAWCALGDEAGDTHFGNSVLDAARKILAACGASFAAKDAADAIERAQTEVKVRRGPSPSTRSS
ncbi:hypothetical protein L1787_13095 [Acuticoccus sp. M5D2P5]|uniref:hypothetical protein n=1 Tax=Acuticoccus kalidii TaxID=2910977 RepID=UPI001F3BC613|nr:hypothetical protein [Acuticoccus kalidii]MCF3934346.1 hypothetical protein [Acuticoccus kalidii]